MKPVEKLKSDLLLLKKFDGGTFFRGAPYNVFGSAGHRYRFNPVLSEVELEKFEADHVISLPADYRTFIAKVENGGAGPGYGLFKLEEWSKELVDEAPAPGFLATAFPYTAMWNSNRPDDEDNDPLYYETDAFNQWSNEYFDNRHVSGSIRLSHYGCGIYYFLVVTGIERGTIWVDDRCSDCGIYPAISKVTRSKMNFTQWY